MGILHRHAHVASCLAEHGLTGPVIGVAFDGAGCGHEGDPWRGEFLIADLATSRRAGHVLPVDRSVAAAWLEPMVDEEAPYAFDVGEKGAFAVDLGRALEAATEDLRRTATSARVAARVQATLVEVVARGCERAQRDHATTYVVLTGGCFHNRLLTERVMAWLTSDGFEVLVHRKVPPSDAGIALGQAAIAAFRMRESGLVERGG